MKILSSFLLHDLKLSKPIRLSFPIKFTSHVTSVCRSLLFLVTEKSCHLLVGTGRHKHVVPLVVFCKSKQFALVHRLRQDRDGTESTHLWSHVRHFNPIENGMSTRTFLVCDCSDSVAERISYRRGSRL